jgi:hypothetical protein
MAIVLEVARYRPEGAPVAHLVDSVLNYVESIGLEAAVRLLQAAKQEIGEEPFAAQTHEAAPSTPAGL